MSKFLYNDAFLGLKIAFILANSADPDEMPHYADFILVFTVCRHTCLLVSRIKRVENPY